MWFKKLSSGYIVDARTREYIYDFHFYFLVDVGSDNLPHLGSQCPRCDLWSITFTHQVTWDKYLLKHVRLLTCRVHPSTSPCMTHPTLSVAASSNTTCNDPRQLTFRNSLYITTQFLGFSMWDVTRPHLNRNVLVVSPWSITPIYQAI